jgi:suppressor of ftsI
VYRLALTFADYTDPAVPYMFHCHLFWHEDTGMMGQFVVVRPGEAAAGTAGGTHPHHR